MDALPFPLLSQIFIALHDNPSAINFALLNKTCCAVATDPINLAQYLLAHHGPCQALSYALSKSFFTVLTESTVRALLAKGALYPRYLAQQLANGFCRHKRQSARTIAFLLARAVDHYGDFDVRADDWKRIGEFLVEFAEASKVSANGDNGAREVSQRLTDFIVQTRFVPVLHFPSISTVQSPSAHRATSLHYILFAVLHAAPGALQWMIDQDFDLRTLNPATFVVGFLEVVREMFARGGKEGVAKMVQTIVDTRLVVVRREDLKEIWAGLQKYRWQLLVEATKMIAWGIEGVEGVARECILETFVAWEDRVAYGVPDYPYKDLYKYFPCRDDLANLLLDRLDGSIPAASSDSGQTSFLTADFNYNSLRFDIPNDESIWLVETLGPHHPLSRLIFDNVVATLATAKPQTQTPGHEDVRTRRSRSTHDPSVHPNADPVRRVPVFWDFLMRGTPLTRRHVTWFRNCGNPDLARLLIKIVRRFGLAPSSPPAPTPATATANSHPITRKRKRSFSDIDNDDNPETFLRDLTRHLNSILPVPRQTRSKARAFPAQRSPFHTVLLDAFPDQVPDPQAPVPPASGKRRKWDICSNPGCDDPEFAIRYAVPPTDDVVPSPLHAKDGVGVVSSRRLKCCSRCRAAFYCSKECQRRHWRVHRSGCVSFDGTYAQNAARDVIGGFMGGAPASYVEGNGGVSGTFL